VPTDLSGRPIAITGASSGIGRATAIECARAGMPVAVAARRTDRLAEVVDEITRGGGRAIAVACDVNDPAACRTLMERTESAFGSIYAVFANAGYGIEGDVVSLSERDFRAMLETNFFGTMYTVMPAIDRMLAAGRGHVLICSSVVSKMGIPTMSAYSASKALQDHVGRALRIELDGRVHVSTVHPVGTETEFSGRVERLSGRPRTARSPARIRQTPERVARAIVDCLHDPRGEVWTSWIGRMTAALAVAAPELADRVLRKRFPAHQPPSPLAPWDGAGPPR